MGGGHPASLAIDSPGPWPNSAAVGLGRISEGKDVARHPLPIAPFGLLSRNRISYD